MKRSERYFRDARHMALMSATSISIMTALAVWSIALYLDRNAWSIGLGLAAFAAFGWAALAARECAHLYRIGSELERDELRRAIRPRL